MNINKDRIIKLYKVIHTMKAQGIPLEDLMIGTKGITIKTVNEELQRELNVTTGNNQGKETTVLR